MRWQLRRTLFLWHLFLRSLFWHLRGLAHLPVPESTHEPGGSPGAAGVEPGAAGGGEDMKLVAEQKL